MYYILKLIYISSLLYLCFHTFTLYIILNKFALLLLQITILAMACNISSSSSKMIRKYDVFVSFRGKDTRYNFTDHLFGALQRKGIISFRDDTKLKKGESIAPELLQSIEGSQIFIVVFSKNYASSTWCLRELEKMLDCVQVLGRHILPVFYDVDPSEVRKQSGSYEKAFSEHEERFKQDLDTVKRWRAALTQAANLAGWDIRDKPQYAEIEKIVEEVIRILDHNFSTPPSDVIGMHSPIEELEKVLLLDSVDDVRIVGICGMGGIGKTTLATTLYDKISNQYDACCFIDNVSKLYRDYGPIGAKKQILLQTLNEENLQICNLYNATNTLQRRLHRVKALVVLDNVDQVKDLQNLVANREWFGAGSRIIIICRDEHILKEYGVDAIFKVPLMDFDDAEQLFCRKAFKCDDIMRDYEEVASSILNYANRLPLAIKVLGSFLFDRNVSEWKSALARLKENSSKDIMDVLQLSFDGLEEMEKEIFLDIACFFNWHEENYVKKVLDCCGLHPDIGIRVLIDKSLISISYGLGNSDSMIVMHDLLQEFGRKMVHENSTKEPRKWSRLWLQKYFYNVRLENMEENVEAVVLKDPYETEKLMAEVLSKMSHLRLLILHEVKFSGSLDCLSNKLKYVDWHEYPFMYLPSSFQPNQLVELILKDSNIKQLWEGKKHLPSLRTIDLSHSKYLIKMPDLGDAPNLEWLNLEGCIKLVHIDGSIGLLQKLIFLNLKDCTNLASIPNNILGLSNLEYLNLLGCSKVFNKQLLDKAEHAEHLKKLDMSEATLHSQSTSSILKWIMLPFNFLYTRGHKDSTTCLLPSLPNFSCLRELDISFCGLSQIPNAIGCILCLERLNLGGNNFVTLHCSFKELSKLVYLNLEHCKHLKSLPELPSRTCLPVGGEFLIGKKPPGSYIFNCPKLCERDCSSMSFPWMIQLLQVNNDFPSSIDRVNVVVPGNEIPKWFNIQSVGSSMRIDPSPIMEDNSWIGVACCAVFMALDDPTTWTNECEPEPEPDILIGFQNKGVGRYVGIPIILNRDLITVKSNHLWLIYFTRETFFDFVRNKDRILKKDVDDIKMEVLSNDAKGLRLEVKNWGYRWVYKQDLELLNQNGNSFARKRKFLEIENEAQAQAQS